MDSSDDQEDAASDATLALRLRFRDVTRLVMVRPFECDPQHSHSDIGVVLGTDGGLAA